MNAAHQPVNNDRMSLIQKISSFLLYLLQLLLYINTKSFVSQRGWYDDDDGSSGGGSGNLGITYYYDKKKIKQTSSNNKINAHTAWTQTGLPLNDFSSTPLSISDRTFRDRQCVKKEEKLWEAEWDDDDERKAI